MAIYYVSRIVTEDSEVVLEDFGAVIHDEAINTHEELIELVTSGELAREGEVPEGATLTVQTWRAIDDVVVAESRLEHNGEQYTTTHSIGYSYW